MIIIIIMFLMWFPLVGQFGSACRREESTSVEIGGAHDGDRMDVVGRNPAAAAVDGARMDVVEGTGKY